MRYGWKYIKNRLSSTHCSVYQQNEPKIKFFNKLPNLKKQENNMRISNSKVPVDQETKKNLMDPCSRSSKSRLLKYRSPSNSTTKKAFTRKLQPRHRDPY